MAEFMDNARNTAGNIGQQASSIASNVGEKIGNVGENISSGIADIRSNIGNVVSGFSSQGVASGATEFVNSNSIIAKFVFIILVLIAFMFFVSLGIKMLGYITSPQSNPYLILGMVPGNAGQTIPQDPKIKGSQTILRSNNKDTGLEFTWSVWLLVTGTNNYKSGVTYTGIKYQHVFNKGDNNYNAKAGDVNNGIASVNNGPGLYIVNGDSGAINLHIVMDNNNATKGLPDIVDVSSVPLNKWFNVVIRMENTILDTYINGTIASRHQMISVPSQNYYDVQVCQNGGFVGNLSNLRYYPSAISVFDINNIVIGGPNLSLSSLISDATSSAYPYYFANMWYTNKI